MKSKKYMKKKQLTYTNDSGFKTPENYFEKFDEQLFSRLQEEAGDVEKIAPGFTIPKNYFRKLHVDLPNEKETKIIPLFHKKIIKYAVSIAAMLVFTFSIFNEYENGKISFSTLGYESIETYIENDNIDFSQSQIERILSQDSNVSEVEFNTLADDAIFDYLINNSNELSFMGQ